MNSSTHSSFSRIYIYIEKTKTKKSIVKEQWDPISNQSTRKREKGKILCILKFLQQKKSDYTKKIIIKLRIFSYSIVIYSQFNFLYNLHTHFVFYLYSFNEGGK